MNAVLRKQLRIYLDSNVYISVANKEIGRNWRALFVEAEDFLDHAKKMGHSIVLSDWFFEEIRGVARESKEDIVKYFENSGVTVELLEKQGNISPTELRELGAHRADALHAAIAIRTRCDCIVTFNAKDFEKAKSRIRVFEPVTFLLEGRSF